MATYRERREARADRLRGWADGREAKADAAFGGATQLADQIPLGQPILVGHHSEGRHRRDLARIDAGMTKGVEHTRKAESMRAKAANIDAAAARAIYSDDPDAIDRLREKLERLEAERARIKAYNATCRKGAADLTLLDAKQQRDLANTARVAAYSIGKGGQFPKYHLTNMSGVIKTTRDRLTKLEGALTQ